MAAKKVTIREVAEKAGVSAMTVSNVLAGRNGFNGATADAVREAAHRLGYRPNAAARAMARQRFGSVALLLGTAESSSVIPRMLLEGIGQALSLSDFHLVVARIDDDRLTDPSYVPHILREWMADGLLINYHARLPPRMIELIRSQHLPAIWINSKHAHDCVYPDDWGASAEATRRLIALGHRRIAYVDYSTPANEQPWHYSAPDREGGYLEVMRAAGLPPRVVRFPRRLPPAEQLTFTRAWLGAPDRPTATLSYNPHSAEMIVHAAGLLGLAIPRDHSVMTFDVRVLQSLGVEIGFMELPEAQIGATAVANLKRKIASPRLELPPVAVPLRFVEGTTLGGCRG